LQEQGVLSVLSNMDFRPPIHRDSGDRHLITRRVEPRAID
jgi:hypothetical protein